MDPKRLPKIMIHWKPEGRKKEPVLEEPGKMGYTGCHRRNGPNFGRVFLMLNYTDITQNTYIQS